MCGIAAFINFSDNETLATNAGTCQLHRGPDAQKIWKHNNVALSHQRLSIIDLDSRSDQPFIKDGLVIIFNGEIYNYQELREGIEASHPDILFKTSSDTEVLLELYRIKKERCLDDLEGMFAFAIFDLNTEVLFVARDHFGIKPLLYTTINNSFAIASELKTLVKLPGFEKKLNYNALVGALNYLWVPGNETMFENCFKLPPAHYLRINTKATKLSINPVRYWQLDTTIVHRGEAETVSFVADYVEGAVRKHMIADVPVSTFLSGGLDSSLISVIAGSVNANLSTYTIATDPEDKKIEQMPEDEHYARKLATKHQFDHHEILVKSNIVKDLPEMVYFLDEPIGDPAAINTYLICKAARAKGVKVLLSGMGADEIFFGYRRQQATLLSARYKKIPTFARLPLKALINALPVKVMGKGIKLTRWAKRFLSFAELPTEEAYMRSYSYYDFAELQQLVKADIGSAYQNLRQSHKALFNSNYSGDPINQMCYTDIHMFMLGLNLTYSDRASMAASVELRVPFIDKQVISKTMQIAGDLKYKTSQSKYVLKKAAEKYLPHDIIYRPKASFGAPIRSWISGELRPMVDDLLSRKSVEARGLFNYSYIHEMVQEDRKGTADHAYRIYQLLTTELWCRAFLDN